MYVDQYQDRVSVTYISAHTGHELGPSQLPFLPLPKSTKELIAAKLSLGVSSDRIIEGM